MSSIAYVDGFYYVLDDKTIVEYKTGLIALSGGVKGELSDLILNVGEKQAEESLIWWKEQFANDFYIELERHGLEEEKHVNDTLLKLAQKHQIKVVAANNSHYLIEEDANAHDILLCVKDAELQSTPIGRGFRYGFPNSQYFFKSSEEMKSLLRYS